MTQEIKDRQATRADDKNKSNHFISAGAIIAAGALAIGLVDGTVEHGLSDIFGSPSTSPSTKVAKLTPKQATKTTTEFTEMVSPLQEDQIGYLPSIVVTAKPGDGAWSLTKEVDGTIPNDNLRNEVQNRVELAADESTGGFKVGDNYSVPVVPEDLMGQGHMPIPSNVEQQLDAFQMQSSLPENPAASGSHS